MKLQLHHCQQKLSWETRLLPLSGCNKSLPVWCQRSQVGRWNFHPHSAVTSFSPQCHWKPLRDSHLAAMRWYDRRVIGELSLPASTKTVPLLQCQWRSKPCEGHVGSSGTPSTPNQEMSWRPSGDPEILPPFSSNGVALGLKRDQVGNLDLYPHLAVSASPTDIVLWRADKTEDLDKIQSLTT